MDDVGNKKKQKSIRDRIFFKKYFGFKGAMDGGSVNLMNSLSS